MAVGTCCHMALVFSIMYLYKKIYFELCPFLFFLFKNSCVMFVDVCFMFAK